MKLFYILVLLHFFIVSHAQLNWEDTQGPEGGAFLELYVHGDSTYAASYRSVYKYINDSIQWREIAQGNFHKVKSHGDQAFSFFRIKEDKFLFTFSNDKSQTWDTLTILEEDSIYIEDIALDSSYYYVLISDQVQRQEYLLRTTSSNTAWDTISTLPSLTAVDVFYHRLYLHTYDSLLYSDDHGHSFSKINLPIDRLSGAKVEAKENKIALGTDNRLYYSQDLGETWEKVPGNYDSNPPHITITPHNDLYAEYFDHLIQVHDFGDSISYHNINYEKVSAFSLAPLNETVITNNWLIGIYKWSHEEKEFLPTFKGIQEAIVSDKDFIGDILYTSSMSGIYKYNITTGKWSENIFPYDIPQYNYIETNSKGWIVLGFGFESYFYLSKDYGESWKKFKPDGYSFGLTRKPYLLMDTILFRPGRGGQLIRSTDPLKEDSIVEGVGINNHGVQHVNGTLYLRHDSTLFISSDTGISWTKRKMDFLIHYLYTTDNYLFLSSRNPDRSRKVYYIDHNDKVKILPLPIRYYFGDPFFIVFEHNGDLFLSINEKIYRTSNMGQDWRLYSDNNPSTYVFKVDSLLFSSNSGLFRTNLHTTTSIKQAPSSKERLTYKCFPNPTEGILNIEFEQIPRDVMQLHIVTSSGKIAYQKVLNNLRISHRLDLSSLPSGVYFLLLSNKNFNFPASKLIILNH